jgi:hypothetical protein
MEELYVTPTVDGVPVQTRRWLWSVGRQECGRVRVVYG